MEPLLNILNDRSNKLPILQHATRTLSNLCRGKSPEPSWDVVSTALPFLARILREQDIEVLMYACHAISYLTDSSNTQIQAVIDSGVVDRLVELLM